jgi:hypothetical protein
VESNGWFGGGRCHKVKDCGRRERIGSEGGSNVCEKGFKSSEEGVAASELAGDMRPDTSKTRDSG